MKIYYAANTDVPEGAALPRIANEIIPALTAASLSDPAQLPSDEAAQETDSAFGLH